MYILQAKTTNLEIKIFNHLAAMKISNKNYLIIMLKPYVTYTRAAVRTILYSTLSMYYEVGRYYITRF